jgi:hypothetical protein
VARVLLRCDDERHWLRAAPRRVGHLFRRLLGQSEYNERVKAAAPLMKAALRWLAEHTPASAELLRLMDATPVPCGSRSSPPAALTCTGGLGTATVPATPAGTGEARVAFICTCEGTVTGFDRPAPGTAIVTDKSLCGEDTEAFFATPDPGLTLIRPVRKDEITPRPFPNRCGSELRRSSGH